ncbi:MAG: hypothetical protein HYW78_00235 [Parcubacteria group bacterium]|nr:hypothetical protein [Parcubacteria group bacterium]
MQFNKNKFALAAACTMGITYVLCAAFTALFPELAVKFLGLMMHIVNVEKFAGDVEMTFGGAVLGLLPPVFYAFIGAWIFAWLYNSFVGQSNKGDHTEHGAGQSDDCCK